MKKLSLIMAVLMIMLSTMGFTSVEKAYWEENKKIMQWEGVESDQDLSLNFKTTDGFSINYKMDIKSKGIMKDMVTYIEVNTEALENSPAIPQIKMYTKGADLYINKEAFLAFVKLSSQKDIEIAEDFVKITNEQNVEISASLMDEIMKFVEEIDLGMDMGMVQDGNKYTLNLDSDKMIDLLDAYMRYIFNNMDKLPSSLMPADFKMTEEEKQEMLAMYDAFVTPYKDTAKAAIKGSTYYQVDTFEESKYSQEAVLDIKTPMGNGKLAMNSVSNKVSDLKISLPASVKVVNQEELNEMMMPEMLPMPLSISLDGSYVNFKGNDFTEGKIEIKNVNGATYLNVNQLSELLSTIIETKEDYIRTTDLANLGFDVQWNAESKTIDIY